MTIKAKKIIIMTRLVRKHEQTNYKDGGKNYLYSSLISCYWHGLSQSVNTAAAAPKGAERNMARKSEYFFMKITGIIIMGKGTAHLKSHFFCFQFQAEEVEMGKGKNIIVSSQVTCSQGSLSKSVCWSQQSSWYEKIHSKDKTLSSEKYNGTCT